MAPKRSRNTGRPSEPYHFFKVVLEDSLKNGKLEIPPKFCRDYGNDLSNSVFIKVPHAPWRKLGLKKCDGKFWLEKGWGKFAEDYSMEHGHFLLFRYERNSHFHVLIFDMTATEIVYPSIIDGDELQLLEPKMEELEDDLQIVNDIPTAYNRQWPRPHKMMKTTGHNARLMTNEEKSKALKRAVFESENPYFKVVMQSSYVSFGPKFGSCQVSVPKSFSRRYLKNHGDVTLCDSAGNTWHAAYYTHQLYKGGGYVRINNGWSSFVRDNNLKVGDVCAFELVNSIETTFKVSIYQDQDGHYHRKQAPTDVFYPIEKVDIIPSPQQKALRAREAALERAQTFTSENPFFLKQLGPAYVRTHELFIPYPFVREKMDGILTDVEVVLISNGKSWPAVYRKKINGSSRSVICHGWRAFVKDNCLAVGDVCVFEMRNDTKISFQVFIYQAISDANSQPSHGAIEKQPLPFPSQPENKLIQAYKLDISCEVLNPEEVLCQKNPEGEVYGAIEKQPLPFPSQPENKLIQAPKLEMSYAVVNPEEEVSGNAFKITD